MPYLAGEIVLAADLGGLVDSWTAFTPTLVGSSSTLGNGSLTGTYRQVGKTVNVGIILTRGSTTDFGTGAFDIGNLPVSALSANGQAGVCNFYDASLGSGFAGSCLFTSGTAVRICAGTGNATDTVPFTWADGDLLQVSLTYESV